MADEKENGGGGGCCSFFSCCSGCAIGSLLTVLLLVGGGAGIYYYLPGYMAQQSAQKAALLEKANKKDPVALNNLERKAKALSKELTGSGPLDVTATFTEKELNAWVADNVLSDKSPVKLENAFVRLKKGQAHLLFRAEGKELARNIPKNNETAYIKDMLSRAGKVDVDARVGVTVRDGKVNVTIDGLRIGPVPIPVFMANSALSKYLEARKVSFQGRTLSDLVIADGKVTVRATSGNRNSQ